MIEYPAELPLPLMEGYGLQTVSPLQRSQMTSGRARQRRRFTSVPTMVQLTWGMNSAQARLFEGFFRYSITDGAEWFLCPLQTPLGIKQYEARFTGMYDGPQLAAYDRWRITAEVELRERQTIAKDWILYAPAYVASASILDRALNHEWPDA